MASEYGDLRYNDRWPDRSLEAIEHRQNRMRAFLRRVYAIDRKALPVDDQLNYELFRRSLQDDVDKFQFNPHLMPLHHRGERRLGAVTVAPGRDARGVAAGVGRQRFGFFALLNKRVNDKSLTPACHLAADQGICTLSFRRVYQIGVNLDAARRHLIDDREVKITIDGQG